VNATPPNYANTPLDRAVERGFLEVVRALLDKSAKSSKPPLTSALTGSRPNADIAMLLIDRGADVNAISPDNQLTPLILAIRSRQVGIVRALLAKGADPNLPARSGPTPLRAASDSPEIQQLLIQAGAKE
jgi:ankyrin repeat protein